MWTCSVCGEQLEEQFDICWKCGTSRDGTRDENFVSERPRRAAVPHTVEEEDANVASKAMLTEILRLQERQLETLIDIRSKLGCCVTLGLPVAIVATFWLIVAFLGLIRFSG